MYTHPQASCSETCPMKEDLAAHRHGAAAVLLVAKGEKHNWVIFTEVQACKFPTLVRRWSKRGPQSFRHAEAHARQKGNNPSILIAVFLHLETRQQTLIKATIPRQYRKSNSFRETVKISDRECLDCHSHSLADTDSKSSRASFFTPSFPARGVSILGRSHCLWQWSCFWSTVVSLSQVCCWSMLNYQGYSTTP